MKSNKYTLMRGTTELGSASSIQGLADIIGCTKAHIHNQIKENNTFKFLRVEYKIKIIENNLAFL